MSRTLISAKFCGLPEVPTLLFSDESTCKESGREELRGGSHVPLRIWIYGDNCLELTIRARKGQSGRGLADLDLDSGIRFQSEGSHMQQAKIHPQSAATARTAAYSVSSTAASSDSDTRQIYLLTPECRLIVALIFIPQMFK